MRRIAIALLAGVLVASPADAGDPTGLGVAMRVAAQSPYDLGHVVGSTLKRNHWPLEARLLVDPEDRLVGEVLVAIVDPKKGTTLFERWRGYVGSAGWVAQRRAVEGEERLARAERLLSLLGERRLALSSAIRRAVRDEDNPARVADLVLSAEPVSRDGALRIALALVDADELRAVDYDVERPAYRTRDARPALDLRTPAVEATLPPLVVPDGTWFNVEEAPAPASWRGKPILVVTTDPG